MLLGNLSSMLCCKIILKIRKDNVKHVKVNVLCLWNCEARFYIDYAFMSHS